MALKKDYIQVISNEFDDLYLFDYEDCYNYFHGKCDLSDILYFKKNQTLKLPQDCNIIALNKCDIDTIYGANLSQEKLIDTLNYYDKSINLDVELKERISVSFKYDNKDVSENIELGQEVFPDFDCVHMTSKEKDLFNQIKNNSFFKELSENDTNNIVACELNNEVCFTIFNSKNPILFTQDEAKEYLEKYKEKDNSLGFRPPKADASVLAF